MNVCVHNLSLQLEPVSSNYDDGPFRLNLRFQKATATRGSQFNKLGFDVLKQMLHIVYAIDGRSLPPQSQIVFNSMQKLKQLWTSTVQESQNDSSAESGTLAASQVSTRQAQTDRVAGDGLLLAKF